MFNKYIVMSLVLHVAKSSITISLLHRLSPHDYLLSHPNCQPSIRNIIYHYIVSVNQAMKLLIVTCYCLFSCCVHMFIVVTFKANPYNACMDSSLVKQHEHTVQQQL